jgi:multisubunit Na+/H+ antiporter MnhC subunit
MLSNSLLGLLDLVLSVLLLIFLDLYSRRRLPVIRRMRYLTLLNPTVPDPLVVIINVTAISIMLALIALVTLKVIIRLRASCQSSSHQRSTKSNYGQLTEVHRYPLTRGCLADEN